jgi:hypothetical protein
MSDQTTEPEASTVPVLVNKEPLGPLEVLEAISSDNNLVLSGGEQQALESHEVIELQTFSERKAWIEDKIKVGAFHCDLAKRLTFYVVFGIIASN